MASQGFPALLAAAIKITPPGTTQDKPRDPKSDLPDEYGQPLWGAPRIHGELLKLGIEVSPPLARLSPSHRSTDSAFASHYYCCGLKLGSHRRRPSGELGLTKVTGSLPAFGDLRRLLPPNMAA